jgi:hypothetical protein
VPTTIHRSSVPAPRLPADSLRPATIGILSTYPPTQCGLATFSAALAEQLNRAPGTAGVVRIVDRAESHAGAEVAAHVVNGCPSSAVDAVRHLNGFEAVVVQHEYGIYGGPDGCDVIDIVAGLTVPMIIVLHTVLQEPTPRQRRILRWLVESAPAAVRGQRRLRAVRRRRRAAPPRAAGRRRATGRDARGRRVPVSGARARQRRLAVRECRTAGCPARSA